MPSFLSGYHYDIFISYRQKDNLSGWVTEFVESLEKEIESTFKNTVSIYFDSNPHDGLHEVHTVDESLKEKIKCLIFIPIISHTYCDPRSFAWEKEYLEFLKFVEFDPLGMNIPVSNGNVIKRVLPIRIHEIDNKDKELFEQKLGGVMRPVDFIYIEPGVNRPLKLTDLQERNQKGTVFHNQINKVANALKELFDGISQLANGNIKKESAHHSEKIKKSKSLSPNGLKYLLTIMAIIIVSLFGYWWFKPDVQEAYSSPIEKSIAVLPFRNISNDPEQDYFSDGISEELINALTKITNLKVAGRNSSFSFKDQNEDLREVGKNLGVSTILQGSVRKSGNTVRITTYLINVDDGFNLWTKTFDRELSDIFEVQDEITAAIVKELKIRFTEEEVQPTKTVNVNSYSVYLEARQYLAQRGLTNLLEARDLFIEAIKLDSTYSPTYSGLSKTLSLLNNYSAGDIQFSKTHEEGLYYASKALEIDPNNAEAYMAIGIAKSWYLWDWESAEKDISKSLVINPNDAEVNNFAGDFYRIICDLEKAEEYERRAVKLDPLHAVNHWDLAQTLAMQEKYEEAKSYYQSCFRLDKNLMQLINPGFAYPYISDTIMVRFDSLFNTIDSTYFTPSHYLQLKATLALGNGEFDRLKDYLVELEKLGEAGLSSPAYLYEYFYILEDFDKAVYWATKAVEIKDGLLTYEIFKPLPEMLENERLEKTLSSPELDALYEIRRKNLNKYFN